MDPTSIVKEISKNSIRQGAVYKKSKFLKQWRERWFVLTSNYLFTFKTKQYKDPTQIIDLRLVKSIKSYFQRGNEEMEHCGFKIISDECTIYLRTASLEEKWKWLMILERTLELKGVGSTKGLTRDKIKNLEETMDVWSTEIERTVLSIQPIESLMIEMPSLPSTNTRNHSSVGSVEGTDTTPIVKYEVAQTQTEDIVPYGFVKTWRKIDFRQHYQDNLSLNLSRMVRSMFDQYRYSANLRHKQAFYKVIREMLLNCDETIIKLLNVECKVPQIGRSFPQELVDRELKDIHNETDVVTSMRLLRQLKVNFADIYNEQYLDRIACWVIQCLDSYKKQSIVLEAVKILNSVMAVISINQNNMANLRRVLGILQKHSKDPQLVKILASMTI